jgi:hypothetical protein
MMSLPVSADDSSTPTVDYKAVAKDIMDLVNKNPDWGPSKFCTNHNNIPNVKISAK